MTAGGGGSLRGGAIGQKRKRHMDVDNSVVMLGEGGTKGLKGNGKI